MSMAIRSVRRVRQDVGWRGVGRVLPDISFDHGLLDADFHRCAGYAPRRSGLRDRRLPLPNSTTSRGASRNTEPAHSGAECAHLGRDLAGPRTGTNGRHPLPDPKTFRETHSSKFGITSGVRVVAYDQDNGIYASRLWWMLRWLRTRRGRGPRWWIQEVDHGRPADRDRRRDARAKAFVGTPRVEMTADAQQVESLVRHAGLETRRRRARTERFRGGRPSRSTERPATFPAPPNHFYQTNLDDQGIFRSARGSARRLARGCSAPSLRVTSSVTAARASPPATTCCALEHAGLQRRQAVCRFVERMVLRPFATGGARLTASVLHRPGLGAALLEQLPHTLMSHKPVQAANLPKAGRTLLAGHGLRAPGIRLGTGRRRSSDGCARTRHTSADRAVSEEHLRRSWRRPARACNTCSAAACSSST